MDKKEKKESLNKTLSLSLLESYRRVLYEIKDFYDSIDMKSLDLDMKLKVQKAILEGGDRLGKNIESLDKLEEKVEKDQKIATSRRGKVEGAMFED